MVERTVAAIRAGEPVILPTDTVYGLCAAPDRAGLLSLLKGRPSWMPVALVCADVAFSDLAPPELDPGAAAWGPTYFGVRIGRSR